MHLFKYTNKPGKEKRQTLPFILDSAYSFNYEKFHTSDKIVPLSTKL